MDDENDDDIDDEMRDELHGATVDGMVDVASGDVGEAVEAEFELDEPGFRGVLQVADEHGERHVIVSGTRPDDEETAVVKDVPADRDPRLTDLVEQIVDGDPPTAFEAAVDTLSHVGVRDPQP